MPSEYPLPTVQERVARQRQHQEKLARGQLVPFTLPALVPSRKKDAGKGYLCVVTARRNQYPNSLASMPGRAQGLLYVTPDGKAVTALGVASEDSLAARLSALREAEFRRRREAAK